MQKRPQRQRGIKELRQRGARGGTPGGLCFYKALIKLAVLTDLICSVKLNDVLKY